MKTPLRLLFAGSLLVLAVAGSARADLITYDLVYVPHDGNGENGTGTITIDTALVNNTPDTDTAQDGTNFVTAFSLTITGPVGGTWGFTDFNGSTDEYFPPGISATPVPSGGFVLLIGSNPVDFTQELVSQGVELQLQPNVEGAPFAQGADDIALQNPDISGPAGLFETHLLSMTPESSVPEPSTLTLAALGTTLLAYRRRRTR